MTEMIKLKPSGHSCLCFLFGGLFDSAVNIAQGFHGEKDQFEREFIVSALRRSAGRINQTVIQSGIPKNTLLRKIRKYGIRSPALNVKFSSPAC